MASHLLVKTPRKMEGSHLLFVLLVLTYAESAKILLVTVPVTSQCLMTGVVGQELKSRGHDVTVYLPDHFDPTACFGKTNVTIRKYPTLPEHASGMRDNLRKLSEGIFDGSGGSSSFFGLMKKFIVASCNPLLSSDLDGLKGEGYDLAIVNPNPPYRCLPFVPLYLDIPFVTLGTVVDPYDALYPFPAYYKTHLLSTVPDTSTFPRRFANTLFWLGFGVGVRIFGTVFDRGLTASLPFTPSEAARRADLYLEVTDHVLVGPDARFPNTVQVGALTARPPQPLNSDLEKFYRSSRRGVLVVAFGSIIRFVPASALKNLVDALKKLDCEVLMSSTEDRQEGNVKMVTWIPQNDVLGQEKTRAFLSHCGMSSYSEAVFHAVPILCSPFNADAFAIADRVARKAIGAKMDIRTDSSDAMLAALRTVLEEPTFKKNMAAMSRLLRDRPETAPARAARAVEHVLKYGGEHLRPEVGEDLWLMSYLLLDVWLAIFGILFVVMATVVFLFRCLCCRKRGPGAGSTGGKKKAD